MTFNPDGKPTVSRALRASVGFGGSRLSPTVHCGRASRKAVCGGMASLEIEPALSLMVGHRVRVLPPE